MSRFGPTITSLVAVMWYLKKKRWFAEYYMFVHVVLKIFKNEVCCQVLLQSWKIAMNLVNLPISVAEENKFKDILNISSRSDDNSVQGKIERPISNSNWSKPQNLDGGVSTCTTNTQSLHKFWSIQDDPNLNNGEPHFTFSPNSNNGGL